MRLSELLNYDRVVIQCHDNPDADALASGFALYWYFEQMGHPAKFIYRGHRKITKSNLMIMLSELHIPVSYEPDYAECPDLLVTVDCQYGQRNVTKTEAGAVAIIDHHQATDELPALSEVRSNIGSCATIVWDMLRKEGLNVGVNRDLSTALYYGLYTDTNRLSELAHPLDRDMIDALDINRSLITSMSNSNISLQELKITGRAILDYEYYPKNRYLIIHAEPCDPNILGVISDFVLETEDVDICLAYYVSEEEVKFSVRSCVKEVHANEVAAELGNHLGGGGGHILKAGGVLRPEKLRRLYDKENPDHDEPLSIAQLSEYADAVFRNRLNQYFDRYEIIYAQQTTLDTSDMRVYEKLPQVLGCVSMDEVFGKDAMVEVRTLEGDVHVKVTADTYLMIGIEGEVYPISKEKLEGSYRYIEEPYMPQFEYAPSVRNLFTGERKEVLSYAKGVVSTGKARIHARPLKKSVKLFTLWDEEKYYSGETGDYIAVREDDPHDIYIIREHLFHQLYKEIL